MDNFEFFEENFDWKELLKLYNKDLDIKYVLRILFILIYTLVNLQYTDEEKSMISSSLLTIYNDLALTVLSPKEKSILAFIISISEWRFNIESFDTYLDEAYSQKLDDKLVLWVISKIGDRSRYKSDLLNKQIILDEKDVDGLGILGVYMRGMN